MQLTSASAVARVLYISLLSAAFTAGITADPVRLAEAQTAKKGRVVAVEAITLDPLPLVETISAVGNFAANETVVIRPEIDGRIVDIGFAEGKAVKKGQILFGLDAAIFQAQLDEAKARLDLSRRNYERAQSLIQRGHTSTENLDRTLAELHINEAGVALNEARLERTRIIAPFDAIAGLRHVSLGDFVEAKNPLVTLVSLDPIKVEFRVPERFYRVVREDGSIRAEPDALPGERFEGAIYAISPIIDLNGRSVGVRAKVANPQRRLRPGMFARISLLVDSRQNALLVPEAAILQRGDGQFVYCIVDGKAELRQVRLGLRQTGRVEVVEGLRAGEQVVTAGQIKLRPGMQVTVSEYTPEDPAAGAKSASQ